GEVLVDGVIDNLVDEVVQTAAVIGVTDVDAGSLAHPFEPLQDADRICVVVRVGTLRRYSVICHPSRALPRLGSYHNQPPSGSGRANDYGFDFTKKSARFQSDNRPGLP